jgi:hypothetical protein
MLVAVDECHCIQDHGEIRPDYGDIGLLRERLANVPWLALSATLTPSTMSLVVTSLRLRTPLIVQSSIARENLQVVVSSVRNLDQFSALDFLIPETLSQSFKKSMVYCNSRLVTIKCTEYLQSKVPKGLMKRKLIRAYTSDISDQGKESHMDAFRNDEARIIVCTEACGMGINVRNIDVVVQWGVSPILTSSQLSQRIGRAGRDRSLLALAVIFAQTSLFLAPVPIIEPESQEHIARTNKQRKSSDGRSLVDRSIYDQYTMPVTKETLDKARKFITQLQATSVRPSVKGKKAATPGWSDMDSTLIFFLNTTGCRWNVLFLIFNDISLCDNVVLLREDCCDCSLDLRADGAMEIRHDFRLKDTFRWQESAKAKQLDHVSYGSENPASDVASDVSADESERALSLKICQTRRKALVDDLEAWKGQRLKDSFSNFYLPTRTTDILFPQTMIKTIKQKCGEIHNVDDLKRILITKNKNLDCTSLVRLLPSMFQAITESLAKTEHMETRPLPCYPEPPKSVTTNLPFLRTVAHADHQMAVNQYEESRAKENKAARAAKRRKLEAKSKKACSRGRKPKAQRTALSEVQLN